MSGKVQRIVAAIIAVSAGTSGLSASSQSIITSPFTPIITPIVAPKPIVVAPPTLPPVPPAPIMVTPPPPPSPKLNIPIFNLPIWVPPHINVQIRKTKDKRSTPTKERSATKTVPLDTSAETRRSEPQAMQPLPGVFLFSTQCGGGLCNTKNQFEVLPSRGSLYSFDAEDSVNLARGHMLIIAGDISVNLTAGKMKVAIAPGASMVAEVEADGGTRLYSLASFERTHPAALIGPAPELGLADAVPVEPGQEVVISNNALNSDELIAADGLAVAPLEGSLKLVERTNGHMHLVSYSMKRMLDNEYLIGCKRISVPPSERLSKLKEGLQTASDHEQQINTSTAGTAAENHNLPVSAITSASKNMAGQLIKLDDTLVVPESNAIYNVGGDGSINLLRGTMLVRADKETVINAQDEKIVVAKGAVALVKAAEGTTKVTNLSDLASHSVRLIAQGRSIDLLPAREAIFSKAAPNLGHIFDVYQIGHHSIVSQPLENKGWITTSQIALMDELIYQPLLVAIRTDAKYADAKKAMVDQVMKTAAIFNTLHGRESYVRGEIEDQVTAYTMIADKSCASCNR